MAHLQLVLNVTDLAQSVEYYTGVFGQLPQSIAGNAAFFSLEDPELLVEIRSNGERCDLARLGFAVGSADDVDNTAKRLEGAKSLDLYTDNDGLECWTTSPDGLPLVFRVDEEEPYVD